MRYFLFCFNKLGQIEFNRREFGVENTAALDNVILVSPVINLFAIPAADNQLSLLEKIEMMGDGGLGNIKNIHQIVDAFFAFSLQDFQNSLPGFVAQSLTKSHHINVCHTLIRYHIDICKYVYMIAHFDKMSRGETLKLKPRRVLQPFGAGWFRSGVEFVVDNSNVI